MARQALLRCVCLQLQLIGGVYLLATLVGPIRVLDRRSLLPERHQEASFRTDTACELVSPAPISDDVNPSFFASYPGSGASLVRILIPALTGLKTGVIRNMVGQKIDSVSLKTHFPKIGSIPPWAEQKVKRVIILIRNPLESIPSYCNYLYESENGLEIHSTKAPTDYWIKWRDENFAVEMQHWVNLVEYWMENNKVEDRHLLVFEDLVSDNTGSETAVQLKKFFDRSPGVQSVGSASVPCLWGKVVKEEDPIKILRGGGTKRRGGKERVFTMGQMELMSNSLLTLARKYEHKEELAAVLNRYLFEVNQKYESMATLAPVDLQ